jgi:uncharacterized membrane protein YesL
VAVDQVAVMVVVVALVVVLCIKLHTLSPQVQMSIWLLVKVAPRQQTKRQLEQRVAQLHLGHP